MVSIFFMCLDLFKSVVRPSFVGKGADWQVGVPPHVFALSKDNHCFRVRVFGGVLQECQHHLPVSDGYAEQFRAFADFSFVGAGRGWAEFFCVDGLHDQFEYR